MSECLTSTIDTRQFQWEPKPDITAYELALCMPLLILSGPYHYGEMFDALPEPVKRHFRVVEGS